MALVESENLIVQYVADSDCKVSENSVVRYMKSDKVEAHLRLAKVAVYKAIDRLIDAERIRICSEGRRQGQTHYLGINRKSEFDKVVADISKINNDFDLAYRLHNPTRIKSIRECIRMYDEEWTPSIKFLEDQLKILLFTIRKKIYTDAEIKICYDKILEAMINLSEKEYKVKRTMEKVRRFQYSR